MAAADTSQNVRRVKRKVANDTGCRDETMYLLEELKRQQCLIEELQSELEEERNASASAADAAMSVISRLQEEKHEVQMKFSQFKRFAESKFAHDQHQIQILQNLLDVKEEAVRSLQFEVLAFKHRCLSLGFSESEVNLICPLEKDDAWFSPGCLDSLNRGEFVNLENQEKVNFAEAHDPAVVSWKIYTEPLESVSHEADSSRCCDVESSANTSDGLNFGTCSSGTFTLLNDTNGDYDIDVLAVVENAIELQLQNGRWTLWECLEKLHDRAEQLKKGPNDCFNDVERIATKRLLQRKVAAYSESLQKNGKDACNCCSPLLESSKEDDVHRCNLNNLATFTASDRSMENATSSCISSAPEINVHLSGSHDIWMSRKKIPRSKLESHIKEVTSEGEALFYGTRVRQIQKEDNQVLRSKRKFVHTEECKKPYSVDVNFMQDENDECSHRDFVGRQPKEIKRVEACESEKESGSSRYTDDGRSEGPSFLSDEDIPQVKAETDSVQSEVKQLNSRIQLLEKEKDIMRQEMQSLKQQSRISQNQLVDNKNQITKKASFRDRFSVCAAFKWILSCFVKNKTQNHQSRYASHVTVSAVGLLLLLETTAKKRLGTFITRTDI